MPPSSCVEVNKQHFTILLFHGFLDFLVLCHALPWVIHFIIFKTLNLFIHSSQESLFFFFFFPFSVLFQWLFNCLLFLLLFQLCLWIWHILVKLQVYYVLFSLSSSFNIISAFWLLLRTKPTLQVSVLE